MHKIKILFTIPNFETAGSGKVVYDLIKGLDKEKFAPEICCFHRDGDFFKEIEKLLIPIHIFKFATDYRPFHTLPFRILKIAKFFKNHRFDLIHSWHWSSDFTEPLAAKIAGIPFVYTKKAMGWGNKAWRWRSQLSTKIIAINQDMISGFLQPYKDKTEYIPLGVDTDYFKPSTVDENLMRQLGLTPSDFIILSVANLVPVKGIEILLEAVQEINDSKIKVLVIGADDNAYAEHLKISYSHKKIQFLGKQLDVRPYLSLANLFVISTKDEGRKEGLPIAPLEAMASGVPVIGSNISGTRDILENHKEFLFEASNVEVLSTLINKISKLDENILRREGIKMLKTVENNYTLNACLIKHSEVYCKTSLKN